MAHNKIILFDTACELARLTLPYLLKGAIALSGGSTYLKLFPEWVKKKPDCRASTFFPTDERIVDFNDPQSNWGATYREFLSHVGKENDKNNFAKNGESYLLLLKTFFGSNCPVFDTVFLGVGDDGHTASLFPGEEYLDDMDSFVLETESTRPPFKRVTLAMAPLVAVRTLVVIISGEKKEVVKKIFDHDQTLPITKLLSRRNSSLLFIHRQCR
jgi:6-phosphogluconolactonase